MQQLLKRLHTDAICSVTKHSFPPSFLTFYSSLRSWPPQDAGSRGALSKGGANSQQNPEARSQDAGTGRAKQPKQAMICVVSSFPFPTGEVRILRCKSEGTKEPLQYQLQWLSNSQECQKLHVSRCPFFPPFQPCVQQVGRGRSSKRLVGTQPISADLLNLASPLTVGSLLFKPLSQPTLVLFLVFLPSSFS